MTPRWYDDPILLLGMGLLGVCLIAAAVLCVCLILLWYARERQRYAYDRLPIHWGEPLISNERTLPDVVVDLDVAELQNELIDLARDRIQLQADLASAEARLASSERARRRHLATVRRLRRYGPGGSAGGDRVPAHVPELWLSDHSTGRGQEIRP
jgi:hypothetical protein